MRCGPTAIGGAPVIVGFAMAWPPASREAVAATIRLAPDPVRFPLSIGPGMIRSPRTGHWGRALLFPVSLAPDAAFLLRPSAQPQRLA